MSKWRMRGGIGVLAASALLVAACGGGGGGSSVADSPEPSNGAPAASGSPIKIGVMMPLSGAAASSSADYAPLINAQDKMPGRNVIDGRPVQIILRDDLGTPDGGASAARQLIDQDKVDVLIGGNITSAVNTEIPLSAAAKKLHILWSGCPLCGDGSKNPYGFSIEYDRPSQGPAVVDRMKALGKKKVAIFQQDDATGQDYANAVQEAIAASNGAVTLTKVVKFPPAGLDLTAQASQLKEGDPDVVFLASTVATSNINALKAMKELGFTPPVLGTSVLGQESVPAAFQGDSWVKSWQAPGYSTSVMTQTMSPEVKEFRDQVKKALGQDPLKLSLNLLVVTQDAFDMVKAAVEANHTTDGPTLAAWLEKNGFQGMRADYTFTSDRHQGLLPKDVGWAQPGTFKDGALDDAGTD